MNISPSHFPNTESTWIHSESQAFCNSINYFEEKNLKPYRIDNIYVFVNSQTNQIEYGFNLWTKITHIPLFKLWTLKAKWNWKNKDSLFHPAILKEEKNIQKINKEIVLLEQNKLNKKEVQTKNPIFPDWSFIYTNTNWTQFTVIIQNWIAINIVNDYACFPAQRAAITRAINENKIEKFEEIIQIAPTKLTVVENTNFILEWEYLWKESDISIPGSCKEHTSKVTNSIDLTLCSDFLEKIYATVEDLEKNDLPSIKQIEAAQSFITIMYKRTGLNKNKIETSLQSKDNILKLFDTIEESLANESYKIDFVQVLLQLSEIIKHIFLSIIPEEKRAYH